ncbi:MAG: hypothetical protein IKJ43_03570 [Bacilli bacterium]|nr:hypothetical protein [Bacilli bacterium]
MCELKRYLIDYQQFQNMDFQIRNSWKDSYNEIAKEIEELEERLELLKKQAFEIKENGEEKSYILSKKFDENHEDKIFNFKVRDLVCQLSDNLGVNPEEVNVSLTNLDDYSSDERRYVCLSLECLGEIYCYFWSADDSVLDIDDCYDIDVQCSFSSLAKGLILYESSGGDILKRSILDVYEKILLEDGKHFIK